MFSVLGALQSAVLLVSNPVYGFLYKNTVETFAGAFLVFTVWVCVVLSILVAWVHWRLAATSKMVTANDVVTTNNTDNTDQTEREKLTDDDPQVISQTVM